MLTYKDRKILLKYLSLIDCGIWISVVGSTDEGSDESKGLSIDNDDLNKSISGNFVGLKGYLSKKLNIETMMKGKENPESFTLFLFLCFFISAYKLK